MHNDYVRRTYRIRIAKVNAWVAKNDGRGTWDGAWFTSSELDQIRVWHTIPGAQRWLAANPQIWDMGVTIERWS